MKITDQNGNSQSVGVRVTPSQVRVIPLAEFHAEIDAQGAKRNEDIAFVCPMCGTVQTAQDLIDAGAGENFDAVSRYIGFSCIGRWQGAGDPRPQHDGKPCNWTLGGLFQTHRLEIVTPDGDQCPRFELATPEQAQAHWAARKATENPQASAGEQA